ncbi:hypoxanthine phosphoribosyltransferase [Clostridia bacterium]|nr:hypoxanthine phosphoribosyltransferase [Clostridia bacterium]
MQYKLNDKPLFTETQLAARVSELSGDIAADYAEGVTVVGVLNGAFIFTADLARALSSAGVSVDIDFVAVSSYSGTVSGGVLTFSKKPKLDLRGRDVLLTDDILDTGRTLSALVADVKERGAKSVRTAVLLDKKERREVAFEADYAGFVIPDTFVVGYGLDCEERWRALPYVAGVDCVGDV